MWILIFNGVLRSWPVSIWQTAASLQAQMDRAQAKLEDVRAAKGDDAVNAALQEQRRMETATNEALRAGPTRDADAKASASLSANNRLDGKSPAPASSPSGFNMSPKASAGPHDNRALLDSPSLARAQSKVDDSLRENEQIDGSVVVKKSGFSAAKPLLATKVVLPHHLAPLQVRECVHGVGCCRNLSFLMAIFISPRIPLCLDVQPTGNLQERLKQLQNDIGNPSNEAPWDARGKPLLSKGGSFKK